MGITYGWEVIILTLLFLQILFIWVSDPTNNTTEPIFTNDLLKKTTVIVLEEYIQENTDLRLTRERKEADIQVHSYFSEYIRPNTQANLSILKSSTETVGLSMTIMFIHTDYNIKQTLQCSSTIDKQIRSNFLSIEESEKDFADSMLMNLIKKTINECFKEVDILLF